MSRLSKIIVLGFIFSLMVVSVGVAQEALTNDNEVEEAINLDEDIQAEDLEIGEPAILPDNPFYFLKNFGRDIQDLFTFNPIAKANLRARFANEKLIELKKMIKEGKDAEDIEEAAEGYQREMGRIKEKAERIGETAQENPEVEKFLDKFVKYQLLHQRLLQKLENQVPPEAFEKIKQARERHLERFGEVMTKLEDRKEAIQEKLEEKMEEIEGSRYKNFKNLEVLLELEEKVPDQAKEAIRKAQENTLKRLHGDLENMSSENQERFKEYLEKISGQEETHLEILESLRIETPKIEEHLLQIRGEIMERIRERDEASNCPQLVPPAPGFCEEGRIVPQRDENGCIISFECVIPAEVEIPSAEKPQACIALWDPVCGTDGSTYSNACFAKLAGVEINYRGRCELINCETDTDCPQPRCGPNIRCVNVQAKCIEGKCHIIPAKDILPAE